jgi:hypothetical protein
MNTQLLRYAKDLYMEVFRGGSAMEIPAKADYFIVSCSDYPLD